MFFINPIEGYLYQRSILEKVRIDGSIHCFIIDRDIHKPDSQLTSKQVDSFMNFFRYDRTQKEVHLESFSLNDSIHSEINTIFRQAHNLFAEKYSSSYLLPHSWAHSANDQFLEKLATILYQEMDLTGIDDRPVIMALCAMTLTCAFLPLWSETPLYDYLEHKINALPLSTKDFWGILSMFFDETIRHAIRALNNITHSDTKKAILLTIEGFQEIKATINLAKQNFLNDDDKPWFSSIIKKSRKTYVQDNSFGHIPRHSGTRLLAKKILGILPLKIIDEWTSSDTPLLFNLAYDMKLLSRILTFEDSHHYVITGGFHGNIIHDILVKEGYNVIFESKITFNDGTIVDKITEADPRALPLGECIFHNAALLLYQKQSKHAHKSEL